MESERFVRLTKHLEYENCSIDIYESEHAMLLYGKFKHLKGVYKEKLLYIKDEEYNEIEVENMLVDRFLDLIEKRIDMDYTVEVL